MGWEIADDGLSAVFSRDVPHLVATRLRGAAQSFLARHGLGFGDIDRFICHPGGAKVMTALETAFGLPEGALADARAVLRDYGNMSAATVLFVLERMLGDRGAVAAGVDERARPGLYRRLCGARQPVTALYCGDRLCRCAAARRTRLGRRNTARLRRLGAIETDAAGYPLFVVLHAGWLASLALLVPAAMPPSWPLLGLFALLQPARLWVILSLGRTGRRGF